jgi:hypothetical protein
MKRSMILIAVVLLVQVFQSSDAKAYQVLFSGTYSAPQSFGSTIGYVIRDDNVTELYFDTAQHMANWLVDEPKDRVLSQGTSSQGYNQVDVKSN